MYKVLIVEDTLSIREEINDILLMEGYAVCQAENGEVGFEMALKENPDLIVSDILMPVLNGFEMFDKLQKDTNTMSIPLIFLSAKAEKADIRIGMNLGAEDYLTKPINTDDLVNAIENKIKKKLIRDQKNSNKTEALLNTVQNQKIQLDNYSHLILEGLKPSSENVSDLLTWTKEKLEDTNSFEDSNSKINEKWSALGLIESKLLNMNTLAERVISEINEPPHISISINKELPSLYANESMLEKVFEILIQNAVDHIGKKIGLIELECQTTEKGYDFSIKYDYVRANPAYPKKIFEEYQIIKPTKSIGVELNIAEKIISHYKGQIHIKSMPNKETTYYFNLPKN
jgi:two-component system sensor histidine kinase/response regulator